MDYINCQVLVNDSGQMEDGGGGGGGIAFPELRPASGWTQLKTGNSLVAGYSPPRL